MNKNKKEVFAKNRAKTSFFICIGKFEKLSYWRANTEVVSKRLSGGEGCEYQNI